MRKIWKIRRIHLSLKALAGALAITQVLPLPTGFAVDPATQFADVPAGHWAEPAIASLAAQGIVAGRSSTSFAPNDNITRAEFTTLLMKSLKLPLVQDASPIFQDVKTNSFAYTYIQTAYYNNLVKGTAPDMFDPNAMISRQEMATMITNALKITEVPDSILQSSLPFSDVDRISPYAKKSVAASTYLDLAKGYPDKTFKPVDPASRAAASIMLHKMINVPNDKIKQLNEIAKPVVKSIEITPNPITLVAGETQPLTAKTLDGTNQPVANTPITWTVNGNIGTIEGGVFTAAKPGSGSITASVQQEGQAPVTASVNVTVQEPKHLSFTATDFGSYKPTQTVTLTVKVNDEKGQLQQTDSNRSLTLTVTGPDGTSAFEGTAVNGQASFSINKTKAGSYSTTVSAKGTVLDAPAAFKVVPGDFAKLKVHASPSTFVQATQKVELRAKGFDQWDNEVPPVPVSFSISDTSRGTLGSTINSMISTFTAGSVKGPLTVTARAGNFTASQQITIYTSATDLVNGKGDWMMWRDWKNYPVQDTIKRFKDAGVTHVYLLVSTSQDGFFGQDSMDDFLRQAHDAGIVVLGWVYADVKDPWKDAAQTINVLKYTTPSGDRFDGLAADLEENLDTYHQEEFAKSIRNEFGGYYPMIGVIYPATWKANQPWAVYSKHYDVLAPMVYWHYKAKPYTYKEAYDAIGSEMVELRKLTRQDMPIHIIGQSYNMFSNDWAQYPSVDEIRGAMQAAKDYGSFGYSTYRGRTATSGEWSEFAKFPWGTR